MANLQEIKTAAGSIELGSHDRDYLYGELGVNRGLDTFAQEAWGHTQVSVPLLLSRSRKAICIGVGRGRILSDIMLQHPHVYVSSVSREDLLYTTPEELMFHAIAKSRYRDQVDEDAIKRMLEQMHATQTLADVSGGLPYDNQSVDAILCGPAVSVYVNGKKQLIEEIKRVLRPGGTGVMDLDRFGVQYEALGKVNNERFFTEQGEEFTYGKEYEMEGMLAIQNVNPANILLPLHLMKVEEREIVSPHAPIYTEYYLAGVEG